MYTSIYLENRPERHDRRFPLSPVLGLDVLRDEGHHLVHHVVVHQLGDQPQARRPSLGCSSELKEVLRRGGGERLTLVRRGESPTAWPTAWYYSILQ